MNAEFTYKKLEEYYTVALNRGYEFLTCYDYYQKKKSINHPVIINRIDIDFSVKKAKKILQIFDKLNIKGSFFIRLHAPEYNPFSFENYNIIKSIISSGHEIGYHSEIIDQSEIWDEEAADCLIRDIKVINSMFDIDIKGIASHGGNTGLNNLDFWKNNSPEKFNIAYEAYENSESFDLFSNSFYISDSEWTHWKCYDNGKLCEGNSSTFGEHLEDEHQIIYLLIHSDTYYHEHCYE